MGCFVSRGKRGFSRIGILICFPNTGTCPSKGSCGPWLGGDSSERSSSLAWKYLLAADLPTNRSNDYYKRLFAILIGCNDRRFIQNA